MDGLQLHELGTIVSEGFQRILCVTDLAKWLESRVLASEAERFQLWSHSLRLQHEGHASLDYRVRDSVIVRDRLAQLLRQLADHLEELLSITSGERKPAEETYDPLEDDSSCSSSSGGSSSNGSQSFPNLSNDEVSFHEVDYRLHSVSDRLDALYSLATRIRNPANRPSRTTDQLYKYIPSDIRAAHIAEREDAEISIVRYVVRQDMLQSLDSQVSEASKDSSLLHDISPASWLIRRIGIANARRKQQFIYWKDHTIRLSQHKRETTGTAVNTSMQHSMREPQAGALPTSIPRKPIAPSLATSATKLPTLKPDDLKSVISHQSHVSTIFVTQGKGKLNWPPPPPKPTNGKPYFECPYCKTICPTRYLKEGAWQAHLIHDLQPYTCTYEYCHDPNRLYGSKQEWINHESQHTRVWYCQEHNIEFETQPEYVSHVVNNHPSTKPEELSKELIAAAMGPSTRVHRNCPLCAASFIDILAMQNHLMFHLERLALLALTPASEENDISVQESDSHQAQLLGRLASLMGDFGSHEGTRMPFSLPIH
ncbi:hypothetical protein HD806DRAFT_527158 [Xylariaceae sp. AK1471]|nr:hypothetical protein HD806DRAFT_527158 [Xylariaceae sp. AK1471]